MNLFQNPFYILNVSTRDTRQRIIEACDTESIKKDADLCNKAKSILISPKSRISAEVSWLPGLSPSRAQDIVNRIKPSGINVDIGKRDNVNPLICCNIAIALLEKTDFKNNSEYMVQWILSLSDAYEDIDLDNIMKLVLSTFLCKLLVSHFLEERQVLPHFPYRG